MLRWVTPVIHMRRTTSCETDLFGTTVPESTKVVLYFASANRDERKFGETAPLFDVARQTNPHVAFGYGAHFCLGAQLARVETQLFWDAFFERISDVRLADGLGERLPSHWFAGLTRLMVEWS
jgi:cytochrome P450